MVSLMVRLARRVQHHTDTHLNEARSMEASILVGCKRVVGLPSGRLARDYYSLRALKLAGRAQSGAHWLFPGGLH